MPTLSIRNWEHFQNADVFKKSKGKPPWVKLYVSTLDDYKLTLQSLGTQLLFDRLLLVAAKTENRIPHDAEWVARQTSIPLEHVTDGLVALIEGGWIIANRVRKIREPVAKDSREPLEDVARVSRLEKTRNKRQETREESTFAAAPRDEVWDALEAELGPVATKSERGKRNKAVKELRDAGVGNTLDVIEIARRCDRYRRMWPAMTLTDTALVAHWSKLLGGLRYSPGSLPCPECGLMLRSDRGLREHLENVHGVYGGSADAA